MNPEHLRLFVRVAALSNISNAGRELGLSPAVASNQINRLESDLGIRLLHRTTRSVSLTEVGRAFLPQAEDVLSSIEQARASISQGKVSPQGTLRVTAPASFGRMHLIPALTEFFLAYPNLLIDLRLSDSIQDMVEGGFDVAIRNAQLTDSNLVARKLAEDTRIICAAPAYLQGVGKPSNPLELKNHQCINLHGTDEWRFISDGKQQTVKITPILQTDNGEAVRDASMAGMGLAICSLWCAYRELQAGSLVRVLNDYPLAADTAIWAVYPSSRLVPPKVRVFIDFFAERFGKRPYWEQALELE